jgi:hypothetical protein
MNESAEFAQLLALWTQTSEAKRLQRSTFDRSEFESIINSLTLNNILRLISLRDAAKHSPIADKVAEICQELEIEMRLCSEIAIYLLKTQSECDPNHP